MNKFIITSKNSLRTDDILLSEFIADQLKSYPYTPAETVNELLQRASEIDYEDKTSLLLSINNKNVNADSLPLLLKLFKTLPRKKWHILNQFVLHLPASIVVDNKNQLKKYVNQPFLDLCQICLGNNVEQLKFHLNKFIVELKNGYNHVIFGYAKKVQNRLIELDYYNKTMIQKQLNQETNISLYSYEGIFVVRAIGVLQLHEYTETLASLLNSEDDLLLEVVSEALSYFQTDEVVKAVEPFAKDMVTNYFALHVLTQTKIPLAAKVLVECYKKLEVDGKEVALAGLISQYSQKAIPLIDDYIKNEYRAGILDIEKDFYGFFHVIGLSHPLMDEWKKSIQRKKEHYRKTNINFLSQSGHKPKQAKKVGRNDPCPCGSGKKYKRCCGR